MSKTKYRYKLLPYSGPTSRLTCPDCKREKVFVPYVDEDGELQGEQYGRCNREINCGYILYPTSGHKGGTGTKFVIPNLEPKLFSLSEFLSHSFVLFSDNLSRYLLELFDTKLVAQVLSLYKVSTFGRWQGDTLFWYITLNHSVCSGKVMAYDTHGHRVKTPPLITWVHSEYNRSAYRCLFGEHLVSSCLDGIIRIVESEKTALLCKLQSPEQTWLATGGIGNLNEDILNSLRGFHIIFYPDKGKAADVWDEKLSELDLDPTYEINRSLDSTNLEEGADLGDLIVQNRIKLLTIKNN